MKTTLNYIAKRGVSKWIARDTAKAYWTELLASGWTKTGNSLTKNNHCFTFEGHGSKTSVSYHKMELDCAYSNYGSSLPHPQQ